VLIVALLALLISLFPDDDGAQVDISEGASLPGLPSFFLFELAIWTRRSPH
jgi:hypothetical protein